MSLTEVWKKLESERTPTKRGYVSRRIHPESRGDFFIGISTPDYRRTLAVATTSLADAEVSVPSCRGLAISVGPPPFGADAQGGLTISLIDQQYADIFDVLIEDLISVRSRLADSDRDIAVLLDRLGEWQRFLDRVPPEGLTREQRIGLFGELWFLTNVLCSLVEPQEAYASWRGPFGAAQDYQMRGLAVEVKATTAKQSQSLRVNNELQLDDSHFDILLLVHLSLLESRVAGESLAEIAENARAAATMAGARADFESALLAAGYHDANRSMYESELFSVRDRRVFRVNDGFPRIIENSIPAGVGNVSYSIDLSALAAFEVTAEELGPIVGREGHGSDARQ